MASIAECVNRLVEAGKITREIGDRALDLHKRMQTEFTMEGPPASVDAAAALVVAKRLRDNAAARERQIAVKVQAYREAEQRVTEHPYGREAGVMGLMVKDMFRTGPEFRALPADSPLKTGLNVWELHHRLRSQMFTMFGAGMEAYKPGFLRSKEQIAGIERMVYEKFGVDTGDATAKAAAAGWNSTTDYGATRAQRAGHIFEPNEDWRILQPWRTQRVSKFSPEEYKADAFKLIDSGGLKLLDKDTGRLSTAENYDKVLSRAYSDIKTESNTLSPFSSQARTFQFQPGKAGADAYLFMQRKYGVGDDLIGMMTGHIDHMARTIALRELGVDAGNFAALMRLVKEKPGIPVVPGAERLNPVRVMAPWFQSEAMMRNTFDVVTGKSSEVQNEYFAHVMGGLRNAVGASGLRNLPISVIPGDLIATFLAAHHTGMSFGRIIGEVFDGRVSKEAAAHLQISAHATADYINNSVRKYEDELNISGLTSKVSRGVINATGANWWTTSIRRGTMTSMMNQLTEARGQAFNELHPSIRAFLDNYGFSASEWDQIRAPEPTLIAGARYYMDPKAIDPQLYERLINGVHEVSSYMAHQPDARTLAFLQRGTQAGTVPGEAVRALTQFKQFGVERMTTHLMRSLIDGPMEQRWARGLAFTILSTAAGAVSLQAAAAVSGKKPLDMVNPKFWMQSFVKGGAGGIYGDVLASVLEGGRSGLDITGQLAGPVPGLLGDIGRTAFAPIRAELDDAGRPKKSNWATEAVATTRRFTPNTWYTKLAVDRLLMDKLQTMVDPHYRQSFRHAEDRAKKAGGGFWWGPGEATPRF